MTLLRLNNVSLSRVVLAQLSGICGVYLFIFFALLRWCPYYTGCTINSCKIINSERYKTSSATENGAASALFPPPWEKVFDCFRTEHPISTTEQEIMRKTQEGHRKNLNTEWYIYKGLAIVTSWNGVLAARRTAQHTEERILRRILGILRRNISMFMKRRWLNRLNQFRKKLTDVSNGVE